MDLVEIVHDIRGQMKPQTGAALEAAFKANDVAGNGLYNFEDFESVLGKCGLFVKRQDLTKLYRSFDTNKSEQVDYKQFLSALQGEVSPRRAAMLDAVWAKLARGNASITMAQFWDAFEPRRYPKVLTGELSADDVVEQMKATLFFANLENTPDATLTKAMFDAIYAKQGCANLYDDDWFVAVLEGTWGVQESPDDQGLNPAFFKKICRVLFEKVRQRTPAESLESETLRLALIALDLQNTGVLSYGVFQMGLEKFGVVLEPRVCQALFAYFAPDGTIGIPEFALAVSDEAAS